MKDLTVQNQSSTKSCEGVVLPNFRCFLHIFERVVSLISSVGKVHQNSLLSDPPPAPPYPDKKHRNKEGSFFIFKNQSMECGKSNKKSPSLRQCFSVVGRGWDGSKELRTILILLALIILPLTAPAQQPDSTQQLQQYLKTAAENNPALQADFYRYLAALQEAPQVGTLPDPEVMFGYFISPIETRLGPQTARISVMQMFPWFGTLDARSDAAVLDAKAQFAEFQDQRNRLFYRVKEKWYSIYIINQQISISEENIDVMETLLDITLQKYQTGTGNQADVLQAQIELEDLRVQKQQLIDDKHVLIREFNELLNTVDTDITLGIPSSLKPVELSLTKERIMQLVLKNNPRLNRLYFKEQSAEESITAARLSGYPSFGIGAGYMFIEERPMALPNNGKNAFVANITIQIPLFREKYKAKKRQAVLQKNVIQYQQFATQDNLVTEVESALRDYHTANRNYKLYSETQIQRSRQALDVLQQEYATGETDFEEILRLQRRILQYRLAKQRALGNMYIAKARIEYLYGKYNIEPSEISK
ncbi:MAG TPA: TolC family protein [Balneolaceae bacterium]